MISITDWACPKLNTAEYSTLLIHVFQIQHNLQSVYHSLMEKNPNNKYTEMEYTASFAIQLQWEVGSSTASVQKKTKNYNTNLKFSVAILWSSKQMTFTFCSIWNRYGSTMTYS